MENAQLLLNAVESAVTGIVISDATIPEMPLIFVNEAFIKMTGYPKEDCIGVNCRFLQSDDNDQEGLTVLRQAIKDQKDCKVILKNYKKDGTLFWNELSISPVFDNQNKLTHFIGVQHDVTERVESEQKAIELNKQLNNRTLLLEDLNKELEMFSYSVSHDLRAPLRHVMGYTEMLRKKSFDSLDEKGKRYFDIIDTSAKKMSLLIDELLVFSKMSRAEMNHSNIKTKTIVERVLETLGARKNTNVQFVIDELPTIYADNVLLDLVFQNLLSNAIKYSSKTEQPIIKISVSENEDEFIFSIADNGAGFDMRYYNKLFGIFQRLHTQEEFEGTGIGLANVKRIIQRHKGKIWAESELNKGATFYFSIPKK